MLWLWISVLALTTAGSVTSAAPWTAEWHAWSNGDEQRAAGIGGGLPSEDSPTEEVPLRIMRRSSPSQWSNAASDADPASVDLLPCDLPVLLRLEDVLALQDIVEGIRHFEKEEIFADPR